MISYILYLSLGLLIFVVLFGLTHWVDRFESRD